MTTGMTGASGATETIGTIGPPMLAASGVEVRWGKTDLPALVVPSLEVRRGETLAVMGPNGAGKSTLLLVLALLLQPTSGRIGVAGETATPTNALALRRRMAVVFQEPLLLDTTVARNVATGLELRGVPRKERERRVAEWLERFGIADLARRSARSLSGGEAQRTSLARAFALGPEVLLLDEPFSALDAPTRSAITQDLLGVLRATRMTTVLVTHDRDEALEFGDRVGVLVRGELRQVGPPAEVFGTPADAEVASFVGVETIAPGTVVAQDEGLARVRVGGSLVEVDSPLDAGTPVLLCLRPEDVTLYPRTAGGPVPRGSARNQLVGTVTAVNPWGAQVRVTLDCGFALTAVVTRRSAAELGISERAPVIASFKATSAHLIPRGSEVSCGLRKP